jgi:ABC-type transport system involved in multi-copper enzyme maturation permease subunit
MRILLSETFIRLFKSKQFWAECILSALIGIILSFFVKASAPQENISVDELLLFYTFYIGLFAAVFCSLFLRGEYSKGLIRNKLAAGHTRHAIYLTNLTVCAAACLMICLAYLVTYGTLGILMVGWIIADICEVIVFLVISAALVIAYVSIYTLIAMLISRKAIAFAVCAGFFIIFFILAIQVSYKAEIPLYEDMLYSSYEYHRDHEREFYQFIYDLLPTGQSHQLAVFCDEYVNKLRQLLCSLSITLTTTLCGTFIFSKKKIE